MAKFEDAFKITMGNEGGYANNPNDHGGETWRGISRKNFPNWSGWAIVDRIKATNPPKLNTALYADPDLSTKVPVFYKGNFWDTAALDSLNSQQIANQLFDTSVNMGPSLGPRFLQQAVNTVHPDSLVVDGNVGPKTIAAANAIDSATLYTAISGLQRQRYANIIAKDPSQKQFEHAWLSRIKPFDTGLA